jgi:hypothetical protein
MSFPTLNYLIVKNFQQRILRPSEPHGISLQRFEDSCLGHLSGGSISGWQSSPVRCGHDRYGKIFIFVIVLRIRIRDPVHF